MRKSQAIGTRIGTRAFSLSTSGKTLFGDASELRALGLDPLGQLYGDEGTEGFVMVSARTGCEVPFELDHTHREADGDVRAWRFKPSMHAVGLDSNLAGVSAIIFNT